MIKIQLKVLSGQYNTYLHLKSLCVIDEEGYGIESYDLACSEYAWNKKGFWTKEGVIRADLTRFVKDTWTNEDFEQEYLKEHGSKNQDTKKWHITRWRKEAKEAERFGKAFVKCLEKGASLSEEKAQELYSVIREKLVKCCEFGFNNLIDNFWFKIGNEVIVEVDNELAYDKAWNKKTMAKAKVMLTA